MLLIEKAIPPALLLLFAEEIVPLDEEEVELNGHYRNHQEPSPEILPEQALEELPQEQANHEELPPTP